MLAAANAPPHPELGPHLASFGANRRPGWVLLGLAGALLALALLLLALALSQQVAGAALLGLLSLLLALVAYLFFRFQFSLEVVVYEEGFVSQRGRRRVACRWQEIAGVEEWQYRSHSLQGSGPSRPADWSYRVRLRDGRRLELGGLQDGRRLGELIKARMPMSI